MNAMSVPIPATNSLSTEKFEKPISMQQEPKP